MVSEKYACAYKEVIEVLKHTKKEDVCKIPSYKILLYAKYMNNNYKFKIDETKNIEEQNLSQEAKAILANLYRDYWASTYQKQRIKEKEQYDIEKILKDKYNPDNLFKNTNRGIQKETQQSEETRMTIFQEEKWYQKIFNLIKNIFHRN